jgi:hypothetical protein
MVSQQHTHRLAHTFKRAIGGMARIVKVVYGHQRIIVIRVMRHADTVMYAPNVSTHIKSSPTLHASVLTMIVASMNGTDSRNRAGVVVSADVAA